MAIRQILPLSSFFFSMNDTTDGGGDDSDNSHGDGDGDINDYYDDGDDGE